MLIQMADPTPIPRPPTSPLGRPGPADACEREIRRHSARRRFARDGSGPGPRAAGEARRPAGAIA